MQAQNAYSFGPESESGELLLRIADTDSSNMRQTVPTDQQ